MNHPSDNIIHATDTTVIVFGGLTGIASLFSEIINPLLTAVVLLTTIIYTVARIRAIKKPKKDE